MIGAEDSNLGKECRTVTSVENCKSPDPASSHFHTMTPDFTWMQSFIIQLLTQSQCVLVTVLGAEERAMNRKDRCRENTGQKLFGSESQNGNVGEE